MSVWISPQELAALPTTGAAWDAVYSAANSSWGTAQASNQDSDHDIYCLSGAIVSARTGSINLKTKTHNALSTVPGTESGGRTLALGRNLAAYSAAADISGYRESAFVAWVKTVRNRTLDGMTLIQCQEKRGNNWGTMASGSLAAAEAYLGDAAALQRTAKVLRGWLGDRSFYAGFDWGGLDWQTDKTKPVGINPAGSVVNGKHVETLPDDQRRGGGFTWPPPCENYVFGGLGGILIAIEVLRRNGYPDAPTWSDSAPKRAAAWIAGTVDGKKGCVWGGDDAWQPSLIRYLYGIQVPGGQATSHGKPMAWTTYTHGANLAPPPPTDPPPETDCTAQKVALAAAQSVFAEKLSNLTAAQTAHDNALQTVKTAQVALDNCENPNQP